MSASDLRSRQLGERFLALRRAVDTELVDEVLVNDVDTYTSPEHHERERTEVLERLWHAVGLSCDLGEIGSYFTVDLDDLPLVLTRAADGRPRALVNVCRHRGARLVDGDGIAPNGLTCPYHAWRYGLDGALCAQPGSSGGFDDVPRDGLALGELPVAEAGGVLFVSRSRPGVAIDEHLGEFAEVLAWFGLEGYHFFRAAEGRFAMNWKMAVDTFLESYHIFSLHKRNVAATFLSVPVMVDTFGPHVCTATWQKSTPSDPAKLATNDDVRKHATLTSLLFPTAIVNLPITGHAELWNVYPAGGVDGVRVTMRFYVPEIPATERSARFWEKNFELSRDVVFGEDFALQERSYRPLVARATPALVYGRNEGALAHFHRTLLAATRPFDPEVQP